MVNYKTGKRGTKVSANRNYTSFIQSVYVHLAAASPFLQKFRKRSFIPSHLEDRWEAVRKIAYTGRRRLVIKKSTVRWFVFISLLEPRETFHGSWIVGPEITKRHLYLFPSLSFFAFDKGRKMYASRTNWVTEGNCRTKRKTGQKSRHSMLVRVECRSIKNESYLVECRWVIEQWFRVGPREMVLHLRFLWRIHTVIRSLRIFLSFRVSMN